MVVLRPGYSACIHHPVQTGCSYLSSLLLLDCLVFFILLSLSACSRKGVAVAVDVNPTSLSRTSACVKKLRPQQVLIVGVNHALRKLHAGQGRGGLAEICQKALRGHACLHSQLF